MTSSGVFSSMTFWSNILFKRSSVVLMPPNWLLRSAFNVSDDTTRGREVREPCLEEPEWVAKIRGGGADVAVTLYSTADTFENVTLQLLQWAFALKSIELLSRCCPCIIKGFHHPYSPFPGQNTSPTHA